jgi:hypothetical protein
MVTAQTTSWFPPMGAACSFCLSVSPLRTPGVSPGVKALLARELEGAKTLKQNKLIFRKCHGRKPVGIYSPREELVEDSSVPATPRGPARLGRSHRAGFLSAGSWRNKAGPDIQMSFVIRPSVMW